MNWWRLAVSTLLLAGLSACATESYRTIDTLPRGSQAPRILMMPPNIELSELTAGGSTELNAIWTRDAERHVTAAIRDHLKGIKATFIEYTPPADDTDAFETLTQLQSLHGTVGKSILAFHFEPEMRLPSKKGKFDWSLGPAVTQLADHASADYALFTWVRDSYSSPGRIALNIVSVLVTGVAVGGGTQSGLTSLVDLRTGQMVWFNALRPRSEGDLRDRDSAGRTTALLLDRMPQ
jgi:hypothetical protein